LELEESCQSNQWQKRAYSEGNAGPQRTRNLPIKARSQATQGQKHWKRTIGELAEQQQQRPYQEAGGSSGKLLLAFYKPPGPVAVWRGQSWFRHVVQIQEECTTHFRRVLDHNESLIRK